MGVAIVAVMYVPKTGQIAFNPAAKTALISGGVCGGLSILWGVLLGRGHCFLAVVSGRVHLARRSRLDGVCRRADGENGMPQR